MRGKESQLSLRIQYGQCVAPLLLSLLAGTAMAAGTRTPATATRGSPPPTGTSPSTSTAPAKPANQADALLKLFPGNANTLSARSDARNFTIEGRVRDVRTVTLDPATGTAAAPATPTTGKTEVRLTLVGHGQSDDLAAHFTCHIDKASEPAALALHPDQIVRLTGAIGTAVPAADRIDMLNCHDLSVTGAATVGDQLTGAWRATPVMVDGTALRKANQARGAKFDDIPEGLYMAPWRLDLTLKSDNSLAVELSDDKGQTLKKFSGRYQITSDAANEAHLRIDIPGMAGQESSATLAAGQLAFTLPGLADKCVQPDQHFSKLEGTPLAVDPKVLKDQAQRWFSANLVPTVPSNVPTAITTAIDNANASRLGFVLNMGSAGLRRAKTTLLIGAYGKLMVVEFSDAETQINAGTRNNFTHGHVQPWGTPMVPEVKVEAANITNRAAFDPLKPLTGKITLRALRRMPNAQYVLVVCGAGGSAVCPLEKPGPDSQTYDFHFENMPAPPELVNPRFVLFLIGRLPSAGDVFGDPSPRVIAEPMPALLDIAPPK